MGGLVSGGRGRRRRSSTGREKQNVGTDGTRRIPSWHLPPRGKDSKKRLVRARRNATRTTRRDACGRATRFDRGSSRASRDVGSDAEDGGKRRTRGLEHERHDVAGVVRLHRDDVVVACALQHLGLRERRAEKGSGGVVSGVISMRAHRTRTRGRAGGTRVASRRVARPPSRYFDIWFFFFPREKARARPAPGDRDVRDVARRGKIARRERHREVHRARTMFVRFIPIVIGRSHR